MCGVLISAVHRCRVPCRIKDSRRKVAVRQPFDLISRMFSPNTTSSASAHLRLNVRRSFLTSIAMTFAPFNFANFITLSPMGPAQQQAPFPFLIFALSAAWAPMLKHSTTAASLSVNPSVLAGRLPGRLCIPAFPVCMDTEDVQIDAAVGASVPAGDACPAFQIRNN